MAEEILGRLCAHERDDLILTTKCHGPMGDDRNAQGANRRHVTRAVEASLKRLGTDRVEILFLHRFDDTLPMEETLRTLEDLARSGKVLHLGASNWAAWQVAKALGVQAGHGWQGFDIIQPMYNLVKRQAEVEILPQAADAGIGVITYSPLGGGLLTGKYRAANTGRLAENPMYAKRYGAAWEHEVAEAFTAHADARGVHPATLGVAWVLSHPAVTAPIVGARSVTQLAPSLAAADLEMTPEWRAELAALSRTPPPATDRAEELA